MDTSHFWSIIDAAREGDASNVSAHVARLRAQLEELSAEDIDEFQKHFDHYMNRAYSWTVWAAAEIIVGGCGDDSFYDFRGWLICQGQNVLEAALANPGSLAGVVQPDNAETILDEFASVAAYVWVEKTGSDRNDFPCDGSNIGQDPIGEPWNPQDLPGLCPTLCRQFNYTGDDESEEDSDFEEFESMRFESVAGYPNPSEYPDKPEYKSDEDYLIALMETNGIEYNADRPEMFSVPASQAERAREIISRAIAEKELTSVNVWPHLDIKR